jgi:hypothetical protein
VSGDVDSVIVLREELDEVKGELNRLADQMLLLRDRKLRLERAIDALTLPSVGRPAAEWKNALRAHLTTHGPTHIGELHEVAVAAGATLTHPSLSSGMCRWTEVEAFPGRKGVWRLKE